MSVEKLIGKDELKFWFKDKKPDPPEQRVEERRDDQTVTEDAVEESTTEDEIPVMSEIDPGEVEMGKKMWIAEKVTSLEKEGEDTKKMCSRK